MVGILSLVVFVLMQEPARELRLALTTDTSQAFRTARRAQEAFELSRRHQLPIWYGGRGRCDEVIGRFCYWYDEGDTTMPEEPIGVKRGRARLLRELEEAHRSHPASDWIVGQWVRYLVEHDQPDSALAVLADCEGSAWWCRVLAGYAFHAGQRFAEADSSFRSGLAAMDPDLRCEWTDWSKVLESELADRFDDLDCLKREALSDTLFFLGQPLLSKPGNDLRTEFLSRRVISILIATSRSPQLMSWSSDVDELWMRYGWPTHWSVGDQPYATMEPPSVIGHERSPAYAFLPRPQSDSTGQTWTWDLKPDRPRNRYAPRYANRFVTAEHFQIARFPRGDSTLVVAGLDLPGDTAFADRTLGLALAVASSLGRRPEATVVDSAPELRMLHLTVAGEAVLVSAETWTVAGRQVARARSILPPLRREGVLVLSDLLLFHPAEELPASAAEAAERGLRSVALSRRDPVGIYWETSGIEADSVDVSISVIPTRRGLLGRIGQGLSLVKRRAPLTIQWSAPAGRGGVIGRAFELDLRRQKPGKYWLRLEARSARGTTATTERLIELQS